MPLPAHSQLSGLSLHEDKRIKIPVRVASTATVVLGTPGASIDGIALVPGDRVLLKNQTAPAENGIYVWTAAASALTRAADADVAADFTLGFLVFVYNGTVNASTLWLYSTSTTPVVLGTTALAFTVVGTTGPTGAAGPTGLVGPIGPAGTNVVSGAAPYICVRDQKTNGTAGQGLASGSWITRQLNLITSDALSMAVLASNQITLPAGTYRCHITVPGFACDAFQARLFSVSGNGTLLYGTIGRGSQSGSNFGSSFITDRFALLSAQTVRVEQQVQTTNNTNGGGPPGSFSGAPEVYTVAQFWLEAGPPPFFDIANESEGGDWDWTRGRYWVDNDDE